ncbi:MAG: hypothetical protein Q8K77_06520, partial [Thermodesulfovibrionales bacterium]|nr:hypothetical protein [Thermodesulfovibrionales bacterium]
MIQKRFISYSLIIHLLAMSLLFIAPVAKEQKGKPFFARLVTAEDIGPGGGEKAAPPPVPSGKSASLPRSSKKPSIPSAKSSASQSPKSAKIQEAPAHTTAPSGSMSQGSEDLKTSQSGIPPGTGGGGFPLKRETIDNIAQQGKGFSP